jgi:endonuclease G
MRYMSLMVALTAGWFALGAAGGVRDATAANCDKAQRAAADAYIETLAGNEKLKGALMARHAPHGLHRATSPEADNEAILFQDGFLLAHDPDLRTTTWVTYKLTAESLAYATGRDRINCFRSDPRIESEARASLADYRGSGFDRGHMANDADLKGRLLHQLNTYVLSNMSPQYCRFNRGIWLSLEGLTRIWAREHGTIYVTSGAVFDRDGTPGRDPDDAAVRMAGGNGKQRVAIPSHYYKVLLRQDEEGVIHAISFLLENTNDASGTQWATVRPAVEATLSSLAAIEAVADVTFFPDLDRDAVQEDAGQWDFSTGDKNAEGTCRG